MLHSTGATIGGDRLWVPPDTKGIVRFEDALSTIRQASMGLASSWDKPTPAQLATLEAGRKALAKAMAELAQLDKLAGL